MLSGAKLQDAKQLLRKLLRMMASMIAFSGN
jgi:hypothetical protein